MAEIVRMPKLSDTMTEGVVAGWNKKVGDSVKSGDVLAEIETDKATMEFESFVDGVLLHIGVQKGESAPVDSVLAILGQKGEDISDLLKGDSKPKAETKTEAKEEEPKASEKAESKTVAAAATGTVQAESKDGRLKASPLAKKMAKEKGIDLNQVNGSGDGGRITRKDIDSYTPSATSTSHSGVESYTEVAVSQMRKTIAARLSESKFSAPHFYLTMEIDMDNAIASRKAINDSGMAKISFNDMVIKAASLALKKHPKVNASWLGDKIRYNNHIHIGVAVAVEEGLLVPVVRFADTKSFSQISSEVREYADKAKNKKLQPQDWAGNTFTISNLGMYGIEEFTAIINPPDACILAVGGIKECPVVKNGQVVPGNVMKVTLSCDHRVVDGATGSEFLQSFKKFLENPVLMLA
jgi:pyruvate dehydrogenase E2 component (dihydrolipoamide acetyltransferase)